MEILNETLYKLCDINTKYGSQSPSVSQSLWEFCCP